MPLLPVDYSRTFACVMQAEVTPVPTSGRPVHRRDRTDRKFKLPDTSTVYPAPSLVKLFKHQFPLTPTQPLSWRQRLRLLNSRRIDRASKQKLHNFDTPPLSLHNSHRTLPAPEPHPPSLHNMCHLRSADLRARNPIWAPALIYRRASHRSYRLRSAPACQERCS